MSIFEKRIEIKPYEYPEVLEFMRAIRHSPWYVDEHRIALQRDVSDYHNKMTTAEKEVVKKSLLAISQIEVAVKAFWGNIGNVFPKAEFFMCGFTFAHNEVVHMEAYSELLTLLGLDDEFKKLIDIPEIKGRIDYLQKYLKGASDNVRENYVLTLVLFSVFIESISLFSQFYIIKSFCQRKQLMKTVDNIVMSTAKEEDIHFQFGAALINIIKRENPELFDEKFIAKIHRACNKAFLAEDKIVDWIFSEGDLDFLTKAEVKEFIKYRFNSSMDYIGFGKIFEVDPEIIKAVKWFEYERILDVRPDFFDIQSPNYSSGDQEISAESLFD